MSLLTNLIPGGTFIKLLPKFILIGVVAGILYGVKFLVDDHTRLQNEVKDQAAVIGAKQLELTNAYASAQIQRETMAQQIVVANKQIEAYNLQVEKLQRAFYETAKYSEHLESILSQHDLAYLAKKKPGLVAARINRGTDELRHSIQERARTFSNSGTAP
jgi:hypothetical protein